MESFQVVVTCNPANRLPEDLQSLKTALEIPVGFPPLMENATVEFGKEFKLTEATLSENKRFKASRRPHVLYFLGVLGAVQTTPEEFKNAALFLRLGLPFTLIRYENGAC